MSNLLPQSTSTASATGNPRNKTALKPGHSIMDWIRLRGSGVDLAGTKGVVTPVPLAELKKHNKKNDAWMAIRGKVYNVTRYMDFHPGGVEELMKGVGMDATQAFDEVHAWVNYEQMLNKCYIGPLCATMGSSAATAKIVSSTSSSQLSTGSGLAANFRLPFSLSANNFISNTLGQSSTSNTSAASTAAAESNNLGSELETITAAAAPQIIPRFDWIQKTTELVIVFYTRAFCNPGLVIESPDEGIGSSLEIKLFVENNTFLVKFTFSEGVRWPPIVRNIVETGKMEIVFTKATPKLWSSYGTMEMTKSTDIDYLNEYEYAVSDCRPINHDSFALTLKSERRLMMYLPIGYHVSLSCLLAGQETRRSYTPVPYRYLQPCTTSTTAPSPLDESPHIAILIKSYVNGALSKHLCGGGTKRVRVSQPKGNFSISNLKSHPRIAFLAAGSGLTPFLGIIDQMAVKTNNQLESLSLHYFNKTERDIWCRTQLDAIAEKETRLHVKYILSDAEDSWDGDRGRITRDQIVAITDPHSKDHATFIGVCGPPAFNRQIVELLRAVGFPAACQHIFQG